MWNSLRHVAEVILFVATILRPNMFPNKNIYIYQYITYICLYVCKEVPSPGRFLVLEGSPGVYRGRKQQTCKQAYTPVQPEGDRLRFAISRLAGGSALLAADDDPHTPPVPEGGGGVRVLPTMGTIESPADPQPIATDWISVRIWFGYASPWQ
jgi:hypothetical protein